MSVMSAGKKPRALVRPLRAGDSRTGVRPGQFRAGEPGTAASRSEKPNVPGVSMPAQPDIAVPAQPRAARKAPARPRLWVVPDAPGPVTPEPRTSGAVIAEPGPFGAVTSGPAGPEVPADAAARRPLEARSVPVVPRPRVAPDEQIPGRPEQAWRTGQAVAPSRTRVIRPASAPSRMPARRVPARRVRRTRLTRRGRRLVWAFAVLLLVAVITPVLLAAASGVQAANHGVPPSTVRAAMRQVVVKPGQSLWSIALNAEPKADPRVVVQQIMEFNALGSQVVVPGESLWVPRG
jgi:hypothetical protein